MSVRSKSCKIYLQLRCMSDRVNFITVGEMYKVKVDGFYTVWNGEECRRRLGLVGPWCRGNCKD